MTAINKLNRGDIDAFALNLAAGDNSLDEYQSAASGSAIYPGQGTPLGLIYCALKLNGEAGELAEHVGKAMRDDKMIIDVSGGPLLYSSTVIFDNQLAADRRELILKEIGDCLWYLSAICRELDITMSAAALRNLEKLYDRQQRNALSGSGDNR